MALCGRTHAYLPSANVRRAVLTEYPMIDPMKEMMRTGILPCVSLILPRKSAPTTWPGEGGVKKNGTIECLGFKDMMLMDAMIDAPDKDISGPGVQYCDYGVPIP
jgi:hypothetical protein